MHIYTNNKWTIAFNFFVLSCMYQMRKISSKTKHELNSSFQEWFYFLKVTNSTKRRLTIRYTYSFSRAKYPIFKHTRSNWIYFCTVACIFSTISVILSYIVVSTLHSHIQMTLTKVKYQRWEILKKLIWREEARRCDKFTY